MFHIMILGISIIYLIQPSHFMFFSVRAKPFINIFFSQPFTENVYILITQRLYCDLIILNIHTFCGETPASFINSINPTI